MGNGIYFKCRGCGHILKLYEGYGFMSVDERMHRMDALNGVYGETARRIMAEEEDIQTLWKVHVYHCTCGNYRSEGNITIYRPGKRTYTSFVRCELCGRRMRRTCLPRDPKCPKCGDTMDKCNIILWD